MNVVTALGLFILFTSSVSGEALTSQQKTLEYRLILLNEENGLIIEIKENTDTVELNTQIRYSAFGIKIDETYSSKVDRSTFSTVKYSHTKNNAILGFLRKSSSFGLVFSDKGIVQSSDEKGNISNFIFQLTDARILMDKAKRPIILDPLSIFYFLINYSTDQLNGKKLLCFDGYIFLVYEIAVKKNGEINHITLSTQEKNRSFSCQMKGNKILGVSYKLIGLIPLEIKLPEH
jgi:hypothetical protein